MAIPNRAMQALQLLIVLWAIIIMVVPSSATIIPPMLVKGKGRVFCMTPGAALPPSLGSWKLTKSSFTGMLKDKWSSFGLGIEMAEHAFGRYWQYLSGTDEERAGDINAGFESSDVVALISNRGGWGCNKLYDSLKWDQLMTRPKVVMGYSDVTGLANAAAVHAGIVAFHGAMNVDAMYKGSLTYSQISSVLMTPQATVTLKRHFDYAYTITSGTATGVLRGGNLNVLANMLASDYLPIEAFDNCILLLEETGDRPRTLDLNMQSLKNAGVFDRVAGLAFGQCDKCGETKGVSQGRSSLNNDKWLWADIAHYYAKQSGKPAYFGLLFGHHMRNGQLFLPLGAHVSLDADAGIVETLHPVVDTSGKSEGGWYDGLPTRVWIRSGYVDGHYHLIVVSSEPGQIQCNKWSIHTSYPYQSHDIDVGESRPSGTIRCISTSQRGKQSAPVTKNADDIWTTPQPLWKPVVGIAPGRAIGFVSTGKSFRGSQTSTIAKSIPGVSNVQSIVAPHSTSSWNWMAGDDQTRASDFMSLIRDRSISTIMITSGQQGHCRILSLLDYDAIRASKKVIMGAAGATCLLNAIRAKSGLVTYYGPVAAEDFSDGVNYRYMSEVLVKNIPIQYSAKKSWWQKIYSGKAEGPLIGGTIAYLAITIGTEYMPIELFDGAILFITDYSQILYHIDRHMTKLRNAGVFDRIAGMVVGTCMGGECESRQGQEQQHPEGQGRWNFFDIVKQYVSPRALPSYLGAAFGVDSGSTMIFPIGTRVRIDADAGTIQLLETPLARASGSGQATSDNRGIECTAKCQHGFSQIEQRENCQAACRDSDKCDGWWSGCRSQSSMKNVGCLSACAILDAESSPTSQCVEKCRGVYDDSDDASSCQSGCDAGAAMAQHGNCLHVSGTIASPAMMYGCQFAHAQVGLHQ